MANQIEEIRKQFCEKLHVESIDDNKPMKDLGLDSLDVVEMCLDLEDKYGFQFTADELASFKTVGDLFRLIEVKLNSK
jgi:acyl carrier protein